MMTFIHSFSGVNVIQRSMIPATIIFSRCAEGMHVLKLHNMNIVDEKKSLFVNIFAFININNCH